jgi:hypothetical protein
MVVPIMTTSSEGEVSSYNEYFIGALTGTYDIAKLIPSGIKTKQRLG